MAEPSGLRERKKARTRQLLADTAAQLFAERGYDAVSMAEVGAAAGVSDQTVYNYFPAKQDLVLDMADELTEQYARAVRERAEGASPAQALRPSALELLHLHDDGVPELARGELPALAATSATIRRFDLELRARQVEAVAAAVHDTVPGLPTIAVRAHAAALIAVFQAIEERLGRTALGEEDVARSAAAAQADVETALSVLDAQWRALQAAD